MRLVAAILCAALAGQANAQSVQPRLEVAASAIEPVRALAASADGRYLLAGGTGGAILWDLASGRVTPIGAPVGAPRRAVRSLSLCDPDTRYVAVSWVEGPTEVWEARGALVGSAPGGIVACGPEAGIVLGGADGTVRHAGLTDLSMARATGVRARLGVLPERHAAGVQAVSISPRGGLFATASERDAPRVGSFRGQKNLHELRSHTQVIAIAFSPDERQVLTAGLDGTACFWDAASGDASHCLPGRHLGPVGAVAFSASGKRVLTGSADNTARLWTTDGGPLAELRGHESYVTAVAFASEDRLFTASTDGTVRLWRAEDGAELARLIALGGAGWAAIAADGRFDTNDLERAAALRWVVPGEPQPLALELFMREYYEPRLVPKLIAGEQLAPLRPLLSLNRAQPLVHIADVQPDAGGGTATVSIEVAGSSVHDLRLYRDRRLVAQWPEPQAAADARLDTDLPLWREATRVELSGGKALLRVGGVRLPREPGRQRVVFSAYAFNDDRVKSATAARPFDLPAGAQAREPLAHIITIGVNAFEDNSGRDLNFAAQDAEALREALARRLAKAIDVETGQGYRLGAAVTLVTLPDWTDGSGLRKIGVNHANKATIRAVLRKLAGDDVPAASLAGIAGAERLAAAKPEDLIVIAFSTHGEVDEQGQFYLLPYDIGDGRTRAGVRSRAISSAELSGWLRGIEGTEMILIIDACYAAAAVGGSRFKSGPMGSRGLGQLAWDKRMRVVVAAEGAEFALESGGGMLVRALEDGMIEAKADRRPKDYRITLEEWLEYAVDRVPDLFRSVRDKAGASRFPQELQHPALFDHSGGRQVLLETLRHPLRD